MTPLKPLLFPDPARRFAGQRLVKILLRAVHVVFVCGLVGAVFQGGTAGGVWYAGTGCSGLAILLLDLYSSAVFLVQVRGLVVLLKVAAFVLLPGLGPWQPWVAGALVAVSVLSSHAPSRFRYFMLVGRGRLAPSLDKG